MTTLGRYGWLIVLLLGIVAFVVHRAAGLDGYNWLLLLGLFLVVTAIVLYVVSLKRQHKY